jgi:hypothetical protein
MDLIKMLRSYANRENIGAMDRSLMLEAADKLEKYQKEEEARKEMDIPLKEKLKEDKARAYEAMCHIGADNEIWQDQVIYGLCKAVYDIISRIEKEDK